MKKLSILFFIPLTLLLFAFECGSSDSDEVEGKTVKIIFDNSVVITSETPYEKDGFLISCPTREGYDECGLQYFSNTEFSGIAGTGSVSIKSSKKINITKIRVKAKDYCHPDCTSVTLLGKGGNEIARKANTETRELCNFVFDKDLTSVEEIVLETSEGVFMEMEITYIE